MGGACVTSENGQNLNWSDPEIPLFNCLALLQYVRSLGAALLMLSVGSKGLNWIPEKSELVFPPPPPPVARGSKCSSPSCPANGNCPWCWKSGSNSRLAVSCGEGSAQGSRFLQREVTSPQCSYGTRGPMQLVAVPMAPIYINEAWSHNKVVTTQTTLKLQPVGSSIGPQWLKPKLIC